MPPKQLAALTRSIRFMQRVGDVLDSTFPCQRKVLSSTSPTRCINLIERVSAASCFGGITVEPAAIQAISVIFVRPGEKPLAVPNLDPRMVAGLVRPFGHTSDARRHSDCA